MANQNFSVGFGEVDITPSKPVNLCGYFYERTSTGVHDRLYARSMAVSDGENHFALCVADLLRLPTGIVTETRRLVREKCGLPPENLILSAIHTHTAPDMDREEEYAASVPGMLAESVRLALDDLSRRELRIAKGAENTVQFIRR